MKRTISRRDFCRAMVAAGAMPAASVMGGDGHSAAMVLVEAEAFDDPGGWVLDQQSTGQMGSSYLLAHGLGRPVADATTTVRLPEAGRYHLFVRTRDWTGPWKRAETPATVKAVGSPGIFHLLVNGSRLPVTFGEEGADWHWQAGGSVVLDSGAMRIALQDLRGFDARCEAIVFSKSPELKPPDAPEAMRAWRSALLGFPKQPEDAGEFDLVVAGGGVAGICASVAAARSGLRVALIQDRPVLGGNSSSEVRVSPNSVRNVPPFTGLGNVVKEFDWQRLVHPRETEAFEQADRLKQLIVRAEPNISLYVNHHVCGAKKSGARIESVDAVDNRDGRLLRFRGAFFADCTGDSTVGYLAGADYRLGRESREETGESRAVEEADRQLLGSSLYWFSREAAEAVGFSDCPWALEFTEESCRHALEGAWNWETGFHRNQATETELTRDHMLRAIYGNWAFQKNRSGRRERYAKMELASVGYVLGKRESRRLMGDLIYSQHDLDKGTEYPDQCVASDWGIDIHVPDPKNAGHFPGWAFMAVHQHWDKGKAPMRWLPYRCMYSRNVANLFMAGRNTSCTHVALAWFRLQRTTGMMGEVVGMAAGLCAGKGTTPRGLFDDHLDELLGRLRKGVGGRSG